MRATSFEADGVGAVSPRAALQTGTQHHLVRECITHVDSDTVQDICLRGGATPQVLATTKLGQFLVFDVADLGLLHHAPLAAFHRDLANKYSVPLSLQASDKVLLLGSKCLLYSDVEAVLAAVGEGVRRVPVPVAPKRRGVITHDIKFLLAKRGAFGIDVYPRTDAPGVFFAARAERTIVVGGWVDSALVVNPRHALCYCTCEDEHNGLVLRAVAVHDGATKAEVTIAKGSRVVAGPTGQHLLCVEQGSSVIRVLVARTLQAPVDAPPEIHVPKPTALPMVRFSPSGACMLYEDSLFDAGSAGLIAAASHVPHESLYVFDGGVLAQHQGTLCKWRVARRLLLQGLPSRQSEQQQQQQQDRRRFTMQRRSAEEVDGMLTAGEGQEGSALTERQQFGSGMVLCTDQTSTLVVVMGAELRVFYCTGVASVHPVVSAIEPGVVCACTDGRAAFLGYGETLVKADLGSQKRARPPAVSPTEGFDIVCVRSNGKELFSTGKGREPGRPVVVVRDKAQLATLRTVELEEAVDFGRMFLSPDQRFLVGIPQESKTIVRFDIEGEMAVQQNYAHDGDPRALAAANCEGLVYCTPERTPEHDDDDDDGDGGLGENNNKKKKKDKDEDRPQVLELESKRVKLGCSDFDDVDVTYLVDAAGESVVHVATGGGTDQVLYVSKTSFSDPQDQLRVMGRAQGTAARVAVAAAAAGSAPHAAQRQLWVVCLLKVPRPGNVGQRAGQHDFEGDSGEEGEGGGGGGENKGGRGKSGAASSSPASVPDVLADAPGKSQWHLAHFEREVVECVLVGARVAVVHCADGTLWLIDPTPTRARRAIDPVLLESDEIAAEAKVANTATVLGIACGTHPFWLQALWTRHTVGVMLAQSHLTLPMPLSFPSLLRMVQRHCAGDLDVLKSVLSSWVTVLQRHNERRAGSAVAKAGWEVNVRDTGASTLHSLIVLVQQHPELAADFLAELPVVRLDALAESTVFKGGVPLMAERQMETRLIVTATDALAEAGLWSQGQSIFRTTTVAPSVAGDFVVPFPSRDPGADVDLVQTIVANGNPELVRGTTVRAVIAYRWDAFARAGHRLRTFFFLVSLASVIYLGFLNPETSSKIVGRVVCSIVGFLALLGLFGLWREFRHSGAGLLRFMAKEAFNTIDAVRLALTLGTVGTYIAEDEKWFRGMMAVLVYLNWISLLRLLQAYQAFGPLIRMLVEVTIDLRFFLSLLVLAMVAVANSLFVLADAGGTNQDQESDFSSPALALFTAFKMVLLGDLDGLSHELDTSHHAWLFRVIFVVSMFLVMIVMLNLLIATMSDGYQRIHERADVEFQMLRARVVVEQQAYFGVFRALLFPIVDIGSAGGGGGGVGGGACGAASPRKLDTRVSAMVELRAHASTVLSRGSTSASLSPSLAKRRHILIRALFVPYLVALRILRLDNPHIVRPFAPWVHVLLPRSNAVRSDAAPAPDAPVAGGDFEAELLELRQEMHALRTELRADVQELKDMVAAQTNSAPPAAE